MSLVDHILFSTGYLRPISQFFGFSPLLSALVLPFFKQKNHKSPLLLMISLVFLVFEVRPLIFFVFWFFVLGTIWSCPDRGLISANAESADEFLHDLSDNYNSSEFIGLKQKNHKSLLLLMISVFFSSIWSQALVCFVFWFLLLGTI